MQDLAPLEDLEQLRTEFLGMVSHELRAPLTSINAGRVVTYDSLLRQVWAGRNRGIGDAKLVRAFVKKLRRKLGDDAGRPAS